MNCFSLLHLLEGILLTQTCCTCTWWTELYYYHLEIDVILVVTRRIYEVSAQQNDLLSGSLLSQNLQALMIQWHFNDMYELSSSEHAWLDEALFWVTCITREQYRHKTKVLVNILLKHIHYKKFKCRDGWMDGGTGWQSTQTRRAHSSTLLHFIQPSLHK